MHFSLYGKNVVDKTFFSEWINNVKNKIYERITHLANNLSNNEHKDFASSLDLKYASHNMHKNFIVVPIDKTIRNIALVC